MKARSAIVYSVLRLLAFLVPFGILMLFPIMQEYYWLAAIFAALIGLSLSVLFLRKPLADATSGLAERRARSRGAVTDEQAEDAAADAASPTAPNPTDPAAPEADAPAAAAPAAPAAPEADAPAAAAPAAPEADAPDARA